MCCCEESPEAYFAYRHQPRIHELTATVVVDDPFLPSTKSCESEGTPLRSTPAQHPEHGGARSVFAFLFLTVFNSCVIPSVVCWLVVKLLKNWLPSGFADTIVECRDHSFALFFVLAWDVRSFLNFRFQRNLWSLNGKSLVYSQLQFFRIGFWNQKTIRAFGVFIHHFSGFVFPFIARRVLYVGTT